MVKFLQINTRESAPSRRLMEQTSRELRADLLILSETSRGPPDCPKWTSSTDGELAVTLTPTTRIAVLGSGRGPGFAFMQFTSLLVSNCYWRPGSPLHEFEGFLSSLEGTLRSLVGTEEALTVAEDFNAKSRAWDSVVEDARGEVLERFAAG